MRICYIASAGSIHTKRWGNYFAGRGHKIPRISSNTKNYFSFPYNKRENGGIK